MVGIRYNLPSVWGALIRMFYLIISFWVYPEFSNCTRYTPAVKLLIGIVVSVCCISTDFISFPVISKTRSVSEIVGLE